MASHPPASLIKFCAMDTALKILNSQALRWSAPHLYNDPFELAHYSDSDFTAEQLLNTLTHEALNTLFDPSSTNANNGKLMTTLSRWKDEERFSSENEAKAVLKQLLLPMAQQQQKQITQLLTDWKQFSSQIRICCFSESTSNLRGWQRFADNHQGIALKFSTAQSSQLSKPQAVNYSPQPLVVTSLKEQIAVAFGNCKMPSTDDFYELFLHKNILDKQEQEWRCFFSEKTNFDSDEQLWYSAKPFSTSDLEALYFGLSVSKSDRTMLTRLIKNNYPHTKLYQAKLPPNSYTIGFDPL